MKPILIPVYSSPEDPTVDVLITEPFNAIPLALARGASHQIKLRNTEQ